MQNKAEILFIDLQEIKDTPIKPSIAIAFICSILISVVLLGFSFHCVKTSLYDYNLAIQHIKDGKPKQAITLLKKVIKQEPELGEAHWNLSLLYYQNNENEAAIRSGSRAVQLFKSGNYLHTSSEMAVEDKMSHAAHIVVKAYDRVIKHTEQTGNTILLKQQEEERSRFALLASLHKH